MCERARERESERKSTRVSVCVCEGVWIQRCGMVKVGLGISRTNVYSQWNPVYKAFIECIFVETSQSISSNPNVILTRQRSIITAGSKRRAQVCNLCIRICYLCSRYQNVEESLILFCAQLRFLQKECGYTVATSDCKTWMAAKFVRSRHCVAAIFLQLPKLQTDLDQTLLYLLINET